jgi:hypothetical protein
MLYKLKRSLAYRLQALYRFVLQFKKVKIKQHKGKLNLVVLMMTGKNHISMTRLSLLSIAKNWSALPKVILTSDGTMPARQIKKKLNFWPGELIVEDWEDMAKYHLNKERQALVSYGETHPFGKKLAIILKHAEEGPVLWIDSDILFFNDFVKFICGGTEDFTAAYHQPVLDYFDHNLYNTYKFNAGLLYISGVNIYENFNLEPLIRSLYPAYDFCTEQSIFAHIASKSMGLLWSRDIVKSYNSDNQQIKAMPALNVIARHYTSNVRHLFWRDAFYNL